MPLHSCCHDFLSLCRVYVSPGQLAPGKSTYALLMPEVRVIVRQMTGAATHGHLRYGIHAMFATHRCASVRVDSRAPMVDRALIADHVSEAEQAEHQVRSEIKI